jgi:DNA ligase-1
MGEELGVGDMVLIRAIADATGRSLAAVKAALAEKGDLGTVALVRGARAQRRVDSQVGNVGLAQHAGHAV